MRQEKTRLQVVGTKAINIVGNFIFYYLATVIMAVAFFTHFFLSHPEHERETKDRELFAVRSEIDSIQEKILNNSRLFISGGIKENGLLSLNKVLFKELDLVIAEERDAKKASELIISINKRKFFGFPSLHKLVWSLGIGIIVTVLSFTVMRLSHKINEPNARKSASLTGFMGVLIGGYFMAWVFYPQNDLPYSIYMSVLIGIGILAAITGHYLSNVSFSGKELLKSKIRYVMNLMINQAVDKGHIKDEDKYEDEIIFPALKKLDE